LKLADLPHVNDGYIQEEDVAFRRSTDEQVYSQIGKNQNYLGDQASGIISSATTLFSGTKTGIYTSFPQATNGNGDGTGLIYTTPNGKTILFAVVMGFIGVYRIPEPMIVIPNAAPMQYGMYAGNGTTVPNYDGQVPLMVVQTTGANNESLNGAVFNGFVSGGKFGNTPSWAPGSTMSYFMTVVYPT
jgi:hypothetical protein